MKRYLFKYFEYEKHHVEQLTEDFLDFDYTCESVHCSVCKGDHRGIAKGTEKLEELFFDTYGLFFTSCEVKEIKFDTKVVI